MKTANAISPDNHAKNVKNNKDRAACVESYRSGGRHAKVVEKEVSADDGEQGNGLTA
jgi:hypothetical protein